MINGALNFQGNYKVLLLLHHNHMECAWLAMQCLHNPNPAYRAGRYLSDVAEDGGTLGVVPGSHRLPTGPWQTLRCSFKSSMTLDATFPQDAMPNHYKFAAPAGTALLFDTACWVDLFAPHAFLTCCRVLHLVIVFGD